MTGTAARDTYHGAISDQTDEGVRREQTEADDYGVPECF